MSQPIDVFIFMAGKDKQKPGKSGIPILPFAGPSVPK